MLHVHMKHSDSMRKTSRSPESRTHSLSQRDTGKYSVMSRSQALKRCQQSYTP